MAIARAISLFVSDFEQSTFTLVAPGFIGRFGHRYFDSHQLIKHVRHAEQNRPS